MVGMSILAIRGDGRACAPAVCEDVVDDAAGGQVRT
jgi:hypothetical protein